VRVVLAGLSARLAAELRTGRCAVERTGSPAETLRSMRKCPAPRLLVISEMFPRAGDVVAAVEADCRLASLVVVAVVGDHTALALALRRGGLPVLCRRGAGQRLKSLLRSAQAGGSPSPPTIGDKRLRRRSSTTGEPRREHARRLREVLSRADPFVPDVVPAHDPA
jgi:hypothetical protein